MKEQSRIANIISSKYYPLLLLLVSFVFVTLFSRATSFLYLFEGADPSIFKQMGSEAVPEGVRTDGLGDAVFFGQFFHDEEDHLAG